MPDDDYATYLRRNAERYEEIKHLSDRVALGENRYASCTYTVRLDEQTRQLSNHDLIVLCDRGNACFGGKVTSRSGDHAYVTVYTD